MFLVKVAFGGDHLRLKPDAEFHAKCIDALGELAQASAELFLVHEPVAKRAVIRIALAKPAVIHHQHFNAKLACHLCDVIQLFLVEIEIGCLPVVDENGTFFVQAV